ncbi:hypothetical protein AB6A40_004564 [Gnathostoma spinigerum]|uniref:F-box domain-containing protein n=1 Tax=Gnathostoma spinigerum TaxID=75299 RepID=A0ABD6ECV9_9BILA
MTSSGNFSAVPEFILTEIFSYFTYKELCKLECVCQQWLRVVGSIVRSQIRELVVRQLSAYETPFVTQQIALARLSLYCSYESTNLLMGVLRRSNGSVTKLSCDIRLITDMNKITHAGEYSQLFWDSLTEMRLVITRLTDRMLQNFLSVQSVLFQNLRKIALQVHEDMSRPEDVSLVISSFVQRSPVVINLELHASRSEQIFRQIETLLPVRLNLLKLINVAHDLLPISLTDLAAICSERQIFFDYLYLRDWTLTCLPQWPILHSPICDLRLSSCVIQNVNDFTDALECALADYKAKCGSDICVPLLRVIEFAGLCAFKGLERPNLAAHLEFAQRLTAKIPDLTFDFSDICTE